MGTITKLVRTGAGIAMNNFKSYDVEGQVNSALKLTGTNLQLPKVEMPEAAKNFKMNIDPSVIKLPAGVDSYISPLASGILSNLKLPSELGNIPLPTMPDLSSVTSKVDEYLSGFGFSTEKLGIRSVSDILKEPDISSLKNVEWASPVTIDNIPDLTKSMDAFDIDSLQSQINGITGQMPEMDNIDLSKYF